MTLVIFLIIGIALMCEIIAFQLKKYFIPMWKGIPIAVSLAISGVFGSRLWFFIENLSFDGRSFFGAIAFSPLVFLLLAKLLKIPYKEILDFIPAAGCITLALVKIQCLRDGCCEGRILYINDDHIYVRFPSQIVEMIDFLLLAVVLLIAFYKFKKRGQVFPLFLILYGVTRFVLNSFRGELVTYALGLPAGHCWSLISIIIGTIWLVVAYQKNKKAYQPSDGE